MGNNFRIRIIFIFNLFIFAVMTGNAQKIQTIKNGNTDLAMTIYLPEKEETVILLHGGPGVPDDMQEVANLLREKYRVVTFDQRGTGMSVCENGDFTMEDYISDIEVIRKELGIQSFHLFGHSWGGLYAQIYAEEYPKQIKSLFLCSPSSGTGKIWKKTEKEVMQFNKSRCSTGEWLGMGWHSFLGMLGSDKAYQKLFKQVMRNYHKGYDVAEVDESFFTKIYAAPVNKTRKYILKYKPLAPVKTEDFPILITYGENDIYGDSKKEVYKRFPNAQFTTIKNSGHIPWKHNSKQFEEILRQFYF